MILGLEQLDAVEEWRLAEQARIAAVDRYNRYRELTLAAGQIHLADPSFYAAIGEAELIQREATQRLSEALCPRD